MVQNVTSRKTSVVLGEAEKVLYGKGFILDTLCGKTYAISPRSFYQVNPAQTAVLYGLAVDAAHLTGKEVVLDAYCGRLGCHQYHHHLPGHHTAPQQAVAEQAGALVLIVRLVAAGAGRRPHRLHHGVQHFVLQQAAFHRQHFM